MIEWTRLLRRPEMIEDLYEVAPILSGFSLVEVCFVEEKESCLLRGTLSAFADFPHPSWEDDANRVGMRLWLEDIEDFEMEGWDFENIVDLDISLDSKSGAIEVSAAGESLSFQAVCGALNIENVYAYYA